MGPWRAAASWAFRRRAGPGRGSQRSTCTVARRATRSVIATRAGAIDGSSLVHEHAARRATPKVLAPHQPRRTTEARQVDQLHRRPVLHRRRATTAQADRLCRLELDMPTMGSSTASGNREHPPPPGVRRAAPTRARPRSPLLALDMRPAASSPDRGHNSRPKGAASPHLSSGGRLGCQVGSSTNPVSFSGLYFETPPARRPAPTRSFLHTRPLLLAWSCSVKLAKGYTNDRLQGTMHVQSRSRSCTDTEGGTTTGPPHHTVHPAAVRSLSIPACTPSRTSSNT